MDKKSINKAWNEGEKRIRRVAIPSSLAHSSWKLIHSLQTYKGTQWSKKKNIGKTWYSLILHGPLPPYQSSIQPTCSVILASEGNIKGYALGSLNAFERCLTSITADKSYVDRISLNHGTPQLHVWTFTAGKCPCTRSLPPFVNEKASRDSSCWLNRLPVCSDQPFLIMFQ